MEGRRWRAARREGRGCGGGLVRRIFLNYLVKRDVWTVQRLTLVRHLRKDRHTADARKRSATSLVCVVP